MIHSNSYQLNPKLDLLLERFIDVPVDSVWLAWTSPEHVKKWFTPAPWTTVDCEIDLRPGGIFRTVMHSPEGQDLPVVGCYLEVVRHERLVWTTVLQPGFRPTSQHTTTADHECGDLLFTAVISFEPQGNGTKYSALLMHRDEGDRKKHEELGFHDGWGKTTDQLAAVAKKLQ